jgi:hypothetical protein
MGFDRAEIPEILVAGENKPANAGDPVAQDGGQRHANGRENSKRQRPKNQSASAPGAQWFGFWLAGISGRAGLKCPKNAGRVLPYRHGANSGVNWL